MIKISKPIVFVCVGIIENNLIAKTITAASKDAAISIFIDQYHNPPNDVLGPFFEKKSQIVEPGKVVKFSNQTKKAVYCDWLVNAMMLTDPPNKAFLIFIKRIDGRKMKVPTGNITVPINDLRFI